MPNTCLVVWDWPYHLLNAPRKRGSHLVHFNFQDNSSINVVALAGRRSLKGFDFANPGHSASVSDYDVLRSLSENLKIPELNFTMASLNYPKLSFNHTKPAFNYTNPDFNYTKISLNYTRPSFNYTKHYTNFTKLSFNYSKPSFNFTNPSVNYTLPELNYTGKLDGVKDFIQG